MAENNNNSRANQLIQAYDSDSKELDLFRIVGDNFPTGQFEEVIKDYFDLVNRLDDVSADLTLFKWGLERVYVDYEVNIESL